MNICLSTGFDGFICVINSHNYDEDISRNEADMFGHNHFPQRRSGSETERIDQ